MGRDRTRITVVGGGFAGLWAAVGLAAQKRDADVVLISAEDRFLFTPLLCEVAGGGVTPDAVALPLRELAETSGFRFVHARAVAADHASKRLRLSSGDEIAHDVLVVALGAVTATHGVPGVERAISYKSLRDALDLRGRVFEAFEAASHEADVERRRALRSVVVVGGGVTGVELAAELRTLLDREILPTYSPEARDETRLTILEARPRILPELDEELAHQVEARLGDMAIRVVAGTPVAAIEKESVLLANGERLAGATIAWAGGIRGSPGNAALSLPVDDRDRVRCLSTLEVEGVKDVFSLGDGARVPHPRTGVPHLATAQVASQQGVHVARQVVRHLDGKTPEPFEYRDKGLIISLGEGFSVARIGGVTFEGRLGWLLHRSVHLAKLPGLKAKWGVTRSWIGPLAGIE